MQAMSTSVNFPGVDGVNADNMKLMVAIFACAMCLEFAAMNGFCRIFGLAW